MNQGIYAMTRADGSSPSRPYATPEQARACINTSSVLSPAMFGESYLAWTAVDTGSASTGNVTANGGAVSSFGLMSRIVVTATANSTAFLRTNNDIGGWNVGTIYPGMTSIDWSKPRAFSMRVLATGSFSANQIFRAQWGKDQGTTTIGQLANHGIGFEIRNRRFWLTAHNGTTFLSIDSGLDYSTGYSAAYDVAVTSDGAGNVALLINGAQVATLSNGPTVAANAAQAFFVELTNGGDTTAQTFNFLRYVKFLMGR